MTRPMTRRPYVPTERDRFAKEDRAKFGLRVPDKIRPGLFELRLKKGAVLVAAAISHSPTPDPLTGERLARSYWWKVSLAGQEVGEPTIEPGQLIMSIWTGARRIDVARYRYLIALAKWAREHDPASPLANPREAVDLMVARPAFARSPR